MGSRATRARVYGTVENASTLAGIKHLSERSPTPPDDADPTGKATTATNPVRAASAQTPGPSWDGFRESVVQEQ